LKTIGRRGCGRRADWPTARLIHLLVIDHLLEFILFSFARPSCCRCRRCRRCCCPSCAALLGRQSLAAALVVRSGAEFPVSNLIYFDVSTHSIATTGRKKAPAANQRPASLALI
jgi:hypothetical protein